MRRRDFNRGLIASAAVSLVACGGGGAGAPADPGPVAGAPPAPGAPPQPVPDASPATPAPAPAPAPVAPRNLVAMGTNFSGMEWALGSLRSSPRTAVNLDFSVPRRAEIAWMASNGFGRNRLPIQWELLQPMLADAPANAQARALIGEPGAFHARYAGYIDRVLDAHAELGARCIVDLHNYCRYKDFRFQPDGSVIGLVVPDDPLLWAWTNNPSQVWTRIMATAPGASISTAAFADFWSRAAQRWKDHPGFGGYGLMNEPHDLPRPGQVVESQDGGEDRLIWPTFARAAIAAIRAVDPAGTIYLSGNAWGGAMNIGPEFNPAWPLGGVDNVIYEVHSYVDAYNNGNGFDWELEVAKNYTAGEGPVPMDVETGLRRMRVATDWAARNGTRVALTETGMPVDDQRFHDAFRRMAAHAWERGVEIQTWIGGNHWQARAHGMEHMPHWHQGRTQQALVGGELQRIAGIEQAVLFDDGPGWDASGTVEIVVHARGHLAAPLTVRVASDAGGQFSKTTLQIPAGANGQDRYRFTPAPGRVSSLRYEVAGGTLAPPPARRVFSLADPVAHAAVDLAQAALAILARYQASQWNLADAATDYVDGRLAGEGEPVRAVADSGFGSSLGNPLEMLNWMNQDGPDFGPWRPAVMRNAQGRWGADQADPGSNGLWCRKRVPGPTYPDPHAQLPYGLAEPHFTLAVLAGRAGTRDGAVFQASAMGGSWHSGLWVEGGRPQARWQDTRGQALSLSGTEALVPGEATVLTLLQAPGAQALRVDSRTVASGVARFEAAPFDNFLIGWSFLNRTPQPGFGGLLFGVVTGRGSPSDAELRVLERYLREQAGRRS